MPQPINFNSITSRLHPLVEYLNKQKENQSFYHTIELNATVILIIFFVVFAISPTVTTISSLIGQINAKELEQSQLKDKINQVIKAQDLYSQVQEKYSLVTQSLPDQPSYYQAANQVFGVATSASVPLDGLSIVLSSPVSTTENLKSFSIPTSFTGSFTQISAALDNLILNRRLIQIPSVAFSLSKSDTSSAGNRVATSSGSITASFNTTVYYWDPSNAKK